MNPNNFDIPLPRVNLLRRTGRQNNNHVDLQGIQNPLGINANQNQQVNLFNIPLQANNADLQGIQTPPRVNANQNQQMNFFNTPPQEPRNRNHLLNAPEAIHARNFREARFNNVFIRDEERLINEEANPRVIGNILELINGQNNLPHPGINIPDELFVNEPQQNQAQNLLQALQNNQELVNNLDHNYLETLMNRGVRCCFTMSNIMELAEGNANIVLVMNPNGIHLNLFDVASLLNWINHRHANNLPITNPNNNFIIEIEQIISPINALPENIV